MAASRTSRPLRRPAQPATGGIAEPSDSGSIDERRPRGASRRTTFIARHRTHDDRLHPSPTALGRSSSCSGSCCSCSCWRGSSLATRARGVRREGHAATVRRLLRAVRAGPADPGPVRDLLRLLSREGSVISEAGGLNLLPAILGGGENGLLHGDLDNSIRFNRPVLDIVAERLPVTLELTIFAMLFAVSVGIPLGIASALRRNSPVDVVSMVGANIGVAMPVFVLGLFLQIVFAVTLHDTFLALPPSGRLRPGRPTVVQRWRGVWGQVRGAARIDLHLPLEHVPGQRAPHVEFGRCSSIPSVTSSCRRSPSARSPSRSSPASRARASSRSSDTTTSGPRVRRACASGRW